MHAFKKIVGFLRLYRLHVFIRFVFLYFLGCYVAVGFDFDLPYSLLVSLLISGVSVNFIYSLNSWFDADIDKINKPERPIPSGLVTKPQAFIYALVLLFLSLTYPFLLFGFSDTALWFLWLPVAGVLYSNPVFSFKKKKYLALLLITITTLLVCLLGYFLNGGVVDFNFFVLSSIFVVTCAAVVPLKDISDVAGDAAGNADNWFKGGAQYKKLVFSAGLFAMAATASFLLDDIFIKSITLLNFLYFSSLFLSFRLLGITLIKFYRFLIWVFVLDTLLFVAWYAFLHASFFV